MSDEHEKRRAETLKILCVFLPVNTETDFLVKMSDEVWLAFNAYQKSLYPTPAPVEKPEPPAINPCFEGLPMLPVELASDLCNPAWRELMDEEKYMEGEPVYSFYRVSWEAVDGLAGYKYRAGKYKDYHKAFTTRPLPVEKEVQS